MSKEHMLRPGIAIGLWAALCLAAVFYGNWLGNGGRPLAIAVATLAILLAGEIWLASPGIWDRALRASGPQGGTLVALWPLATYLLYAIGTGSVSGSRLAMAGAYSLVPILLAVTAHDAKPGAWHDYVTMVAIFLPFKLGWLNHIFPGAVALRLGYGLPLLFAMNVALAVFLFVRRMDGIGYSIGWRAKWMGMMLLCFALIAAVDIPAGIALHFIRFDLHFYRQGARWASVPLALVGTLVFVAWPEEFLFRGLLQNSLRKTLGGENAGWIAASLIFGLAHIANGFFPNWKYAVLAAVAGLGYGLAWRKTGSIFPGALVHVLVDVTWHLLFPAA